MPLWTTPLIAGASVGHNFAAFELALLTKKIKIRTNQKPMPPRPMSTVVKLWFEFAASQKFRIKAKVIAILRLFLYVPQRFDSRKHSSPWRSLINLVAFARLLGTTPKIYLARRGSAWLQNLKQGREP